MIKSNKNKEKGFTLVELLVVIAILAVLTTVSILGYSSFVKKAHFSNDKQLVSELNARGRIFKIENGNITKESDIKAILLDLGLEEVNPQTSQYGYHIWFNIEEQLFVLAKVNGEPVSSEIFFKLFEKVSADELVDTTLVTGTNKLEDNVFRMSIKEDSDSYYLLDNAGSDLATALTILQNPLNGEEYGEAITLLLSLYEKEEVSKEIIDVVYNTVIFGENGVFEPQNPSNETEAKAYFTDGLTIVNNKHYVFSVEAAIVNVEEASGNIQTPLIEIDLPNTIEKVLEGSMNFKEGSAVTILIPEGKVIADIFEARATNAVLEQEINGKIEYFVCEGTVIYSYDKITHSKLEEVGGLVSASSLIHFVFKNTDSYLYRVGNMNAISIDKLFYHEYGNKIEKVEYTPVNGIVSCVYDYDEKEISFSGIGQIALQACIGSDYSDVLYLEIVEAKNLTEAENVTSNNAVLINDIGLYLSKIDIENGYALYGNGFKIKCGGDGNRLGTNGMGEGFVNVRSGSTLDNVQIYAPIYPKALLLGSQVKTDSNLSSSTEGDRKRYSYQWSAIAVTGDSTISNCFAYGGRNNIYVGEGEITISNTITSCGVLSNILIDSSSGNSIILEDITTIQYKVKDDFGGNNTMMGCGILVGSTESISNPKITINGYYKQFNWVCEDDANIISGDYSKQIVNLIFSVNNYKHNMNGVDYVNVGFTYLNTKNSELVDNRECKNDYEWVTINKITSIKTYAIKANKDNVNIKDSSFVFNPSGYDNYAPQMKLSDTILEGELDDNTFASYTRKSAINAAIKVQFPLGKNVVINVDKLAQFVRYNGETLDKTVKCTKLKENVNIENGKLVIETAGDYNLTYTITNNGVTYEYEIKIVVETKDLNVHNATFEFNKDTQKWIESGSSNIYQSIPFLNGLKIYDYTGDESTKYLRFDGDDTTYSRIAYLDLTELNKNTDKASQNAYSGGDHIIKVVLVDGGVITINLSAKADTGSSIYSLSIKTLNGVIYAKNNGTTSGRGTTWTIFNYSFTGNNGVEQKSDKILFTKGSVFSNPNGSFSRTKKFIVTYDTCGGICQQQLSYSTSANASVVLPSPTKLNKSFDGWYTEENGGTKTGDGGALYTPTADITLYAHWKNPNIVTFDANGGICSSTSIQIGSGNIISLPVVTNSNFVWFNGWRLKDGTLVGQQGDKYTIPNENVTIVADWQDKYIVEFNSNGGNTVETLIYEGKSLTLPLPINSDTTQAFAGWYDSLNGGNKIGMNGSSYIPTDDIILYAHWNTIITVTYDANEGTLTNNSAKYDGLTAITLATPLREGYWFAGWYDAVNDGKLIGKAGRSYIPDSNITLYAHWEKEYTITFDVNGGNAISNMVYRGLELTIPTPTREGYTFNGWYDSLEGGNKVYEANAKCTPNKDITLYAHWTINSYKVTLKLNNATGSISYNGTTINETNKTIKVPYNETVTIVCTGFNKTSSKQIKFDGKNIGSNINEEYKKIITKDVEIELYSDDGCFTKDTLITMADGSKKRVEQLKVGDEIITFDHFNGSLSTSTVAYIYYAYSEYDVIKLNFSNDINITILQAHCFYNLEENKYVEINKNNVENYVGKKFFNADTMEFVELLSYEYNREYTESYSVLSAYDINHMANGFLVVSDEIDGLYNYFDFDENMKYDVEKMKHDINTYGLVEYEMFADYCTEEEFNVFNCQYLSISIGKGLTTYESLINRMAVFSGNSK